MHESWHLVVVLISSSLMTNDVEHLSVCSFVLCVSFFFGEMSVGLLFSYSSFECFLYIMDTHLLSDVTCKYFLAVYVLRFILIF